MKVLKPVRSVGIIGIACVVICGVIVGSLGLLFQGKKMSPPDRPVQW